jgi:hypothetical protein
MTGHHKHFKITSQRTNNKWANFQKYEKLVICTSGNTGIILDDNEYKTRFLLLTQNIANGNCYTSEFFTSCIHSVINNQ